MVKYESDFDEKPPVNLRLIAGFYNMGMFDLNYPHLIGRNQNRSRPKRQHANIIENVDMNQNQQSPTLVRSI